VRDDDEREVDCDGHTADESEHNRDNEGEDLQGVIAKEQAEEEENERKRSADGVQDKNEREHWRYPVR
jgi:hypothetical protein